VSPSRIPDWKTTSWNGLHLECPQALDVIVSGDHHLLFEEEFRPVLELRWHTLSGADTSSTETILRNLRKDSRLIPAKSLPSSWLELTNTYSVYLLLEGKDKKSRAALLSCKECGTSLLFYFFDPLPPTHADIATLFSSLCCHKKNGDLAIWAIQDFRFSLSDKYQLDTYNFGAGLTRISFTHGSRILHICRLAPASQRLQSSKLAQLLMILGDVEIDEQEMLQTEAMISHSRHPSIFKQILDRFKRKLPFHEMFLRHHKECDRLTGLFIFDKKPIPKTCAREILDSYEIFPT
jgi:hypothetical protein